MPTTPPALTVAEQAAQPIAAGTNALDAFHTLTARVVLAVPGLTLAQAQRYCLDRMLDEAPALAAKVLAALLVERAR